MNNFQNTFKNNFTQIPNEVINDEELSLKAKGLLIYLISKKDNWNFSANGIKTQNKEGLTSINSGLKELESLNYLVRKKIKDDKGKFIGIVYVIQNRFDLDLTIGTESEDRKAVNTKSINGKTENGKRTNISNTNLSNTIKSNTKDNNTINNIYIDIFDFWNSKEIIKHKSIIDDKYFKNALKENTPGEIKQAIENYKTTLEDSDFYFSHVWGLADFLRLQRGKTEMNFKRFLNNGDIWLNYKAKKQTKKPKNNVYKEDVTKYDSLMEEFKRNAEKFNKSQK